MYLFLGRHKQESIFLREDISGRPIRGFSLSLVGQARGVFAFVLAFVLLCFVGLFVYETMSRGSLTSV